MILRSRLATSVGRPLNVAFRQVHLSHIGSKPIPVPAAVKFDITPTSISIEGPLGKTTLPIFPFVKLELPPAEPKLMMVSVEDPEIQQQRRMWGTTRTLISNAVTGMTEGFAVRLYLEGVGYRVAMEEDPRGTADGGNGRRLNMKLGYSHAVFVPIPPHIKAEVPAPTKIQLFCTDKHQLGLFAAKVQSYRKPEPYKGKGIFIGNETRPIKSVKKK
ncbi:ribosomal protein L6, alpha-beta domain-containing protein [Mycena albidolilacea]|uniref:Ribosomal protein L6, alpha-beta domain-containing protein n=1 Tax=Mycena albidolilacea TaxID=1033008 RepID=A0AAD7ARY9_9AGAR|nr:ribosomal protein L6, alpha-beta domain-containing protein [Mycena albidolilacea]